MKIYELVPHRPNFNVKKSLFQSIRHSCKLIFFNDGASTGSVSI